MKVEFRETGFAGGVLQQDAGLILGRNEIASAAQTPEGIVMEQLWHGEDDIRLLAMVEAAPSRGELTLRF
jgi:hypothetical protein